MTITEIVEQLRMCNYECEAGPLENNVAFQELVKMAELHESIRHLKLYNIPWDREKKDRGL